VPRINPTSASGSVWRNFRDRLAGELSELEFMDFLILDGADGYVQFLHMPRAILRAEAHPEGSMYEQVRPVFMASSRGIAMRELGWSEPRMGRLGYGNYRAFWAEEGLTLEGPVVTEWPGMDVCREAADLACRTLHDGMGLDLPSTVSWETGRGDYLPDYDCRVPMDALT
jgi:hypothetical protein